MSHFPNKIEENGCAPADSLDEANRRFREEAAYVQLHKDIAVASNETRAVDITLQYCLKRICDHAGWPVGHLYLIEGPAHLVSSTIWHLSNPDQFETFKTISEATGFDTGIGLPGRVLASGEPAWIIDVNQDPNFPRAQLTENLGVKAGFAFPILIGSEVAGIMEFFSTEAAQPKNEMLDVMGHIGAQLGRVLERQRAEKESALAHQHLRNLYHRLEMVREEERTRIARELHDELAQVLTTLKLELSVLDKKLIQDNLPYRNDTQHVLELVDQTIPAVKRLMLDLRPPVLDDLGLREAIFWQGREFERRTGIQCLFNLGPEDLDIDAARATTLFRIFQETLTNVTRHAKAHNVTVQLSETDKQLALSISDDGVGIKSSDLNNGRSLGILGMQERVRIWGGTIDFISKPNAGTTVNILISRS